MDFNQADPTWIVDYGWLSTQWIGSNYDKFWKEDIQENIAHLRKYRHFSELKDP
jgi:hypothetical protein